MPLHRMPLYGLFMFASLAVIITLTCTNAIAKQRMVRVADNVFFVVDTSGSMMSQYKDTNNTDLAGAHDLLARLCEAMPDLDYKTALHRIAEFEELRPLGDHDNGSFLADVDNLPTKVKIYDNRTPLGDGLFRMAWPISAVPGPTALILFTDGGQNEGEHPLPVAQELYDNYDVCLHVVSFANTPGEQKVIDQIAALDDCSQVADAKTLLTDKAALDEFVHKALWTMETIPEPRKPPVARREFRTVAIDLRVEFDTAKADIRPSFHDEIAKVGNLMRKHPDTTATIVGYTDAEGSYVSNIKLSQLRAEAIRDYLAEAFEIDPARLSVVGYGENFPDASNAHEDGRQTNRRVQAFVRGWYVITE